MTPGMFKPPWHFCLFDNAGMWGAYKEKEGREKGRTGAGAVEREGRSGTGGHRVTVASALDLEGTLNSDSDTR